MNTQPINPLLPDPVSLQTYIRDIKKLLTKQNFQLSWQTQKLDYQKRVNQIQQREKEQINREEQKVIENINNQGDQNQLENQFQGPMVIKVNNEQDGNQINNNIKPVKVNPKAFYLGVEFDEGIKDETDLISYLMQNQYYLKEVYLNEEQKEEFDQIFKNLDQLDGRNIGSLIGMAMLGLIGFIALGYSVIGIIVGGILGVIMGRYIGRRIKRQLKRKQNKLKQIDIYEIRIRCIIKWIRIQLIKYKFNINLLRFMVERLILEIKPALHYKYFSKNLQSQIKYLLKKLIVLIQQPEIFQTLVLSFKLSNQYWLKLVEINEIEKSPEKLITMKNLCDQKLKLEISLLMTIDNLLKPLDTLISFSKVKEGKIFSLRKEIQKFLVKPEILQLSALFPDPQMSIEFIKLFSNKLKVPVKVDNIEISVKDQNFKDIEMMGLMIGQEGKNQALNQQNIQEERKQIPNLERIEEQLNFQEEEEEQDDNLDGENQKEKCKQYQNSSSSDEQQQQFLPFNQSNPSVPDQNIKSQSCTPKRQELVYRELLQNELEMVPLKLILKQHPNKVYLEYLQSNMGDQDCISAQQTVRGSQARSISAVSALKQNSNQNITTPLNELQQQKMDIESQQMEIKEILLTIQHLPILAPVSIYDAFTQERFDYFMSVLAEPFSEWDKVMEKEEIRIYKAMKPGIGTIFVKGDVMLRNITPTIACQTMCETEYRQQWDKILSGFTVLEKIGDDVHILAFFTPSPFPFISSREFVQKRTTRKDFPQKDSITLLFYSVEHKDAPLNKARVRVQTDMAGYIFEPVFGGTKMHFISMNDVKGAIPKAFVNYASARAPFGWFSSLKKACQDLQKVNGDYKKIKKS